jgi:hypothetical protein
MRLGILVDRIELVEFSGFHVLFVEAEGARLTALSAIEIKVGGR